MHVGETTHENFYTWFAENISLLKSRKRTANASRGRSYFSQAMAMQRIPPFPCSKFQDYPWNIREMPTPPVESAGRSERDYRDQRPYGLSVARSGKGEKEKTRTRPRKHPTSDRQAPIVSKHRASVRTGSCTGCFRNKRMILLNRQFSC